jgi:hypothetical protein
MASSEQQAADRALRRDRSVRRVGTTRWVTVAAAAGTIALATGYAQASAADVARPTTSPSAADPTPSAPSARTCTPAPSTVAPAPSTAGGS